MKVVFTIGGIILFLLYSSLTGSLSSVIDFILTYASWPLVSLAYLKPTGAAPEFIKWLYIIACAIIYFGIIFGIFFVWKMKKGEVGFPPGTYPGMLCEKEVAAVLEKIDSDIRDNDIIKEAALELMEEFEKGVERIFSLRNSNYRCLWVFPSGNSDFIAINTKTSPLEEDTPFVKWVLSVPYHRFFADDIQKYYPDSDIEDLVFIRNIGRFKLGFLFLIKKKGVITLETKQQFEIATASLILLGRIDKVVQAMLNLDQE